jgi:hypothetical protein
MRQFIERFQLWRRAKIAEREGSTPLDPLAFVIMLSLAWCVYVNHFPSAFMVRGREYFSAGRFSSLVRSQVTVGMVDHPDHGSQLPRSSTVHLRFFAASCSIGYLGFRPYRSRHYCVRLHGQEALSCVPRSGAFIALLKVPAAGQLRKIVQELTEKVPGNSRLAPKGAARYKRFGRVPPTGNLRSH